MLCLSASPRGRYSTSTYKPNANSRPPTRTLNTHTHASSTHTNTHTARKQHFANTITPNTNMHHTQTRTTFASVCVLRGLCHLSVFGATRIPMTFVDLLRSCPSASFSNASLCRACRCCSEQPPMCPYVPPALCGFLVQKPLCLAARRVALVYHPS